MSSSPRLKQFRIAVRKFPPFEEAIRRQWELFEQQAGTGLVLDLVALDLDDLERALFDSEGMANGSWDVAFVATDWIASMYERGCAVDLAPLLLSDPPDDYPEGWSPSLLRLQRIDGAVMGVPYHDGPECLIYRKDLFADPKLCDLYEQQFHRPLNPPKTWDEFHEIAVFFQGAREKLYGTVFAAFPDGHNTVYDFLLQLWTRGGELFDRQGAVCFDTKEAREALEFYRSIVSDPRAVPPECRTLDSVAAGKLFAEGAVAMMVNWFGFASYAHTAAESSVRGLVDVTCIPAGVGHRPVSLNVYWILSMAAGTPHRAIAWDFLKHTQTAAMGKLVTDCGAIGCRRSTWRNAEINREIPFFYQLDRLHEHAREIPQRKDWPRIAGIIDSLITSAITTDEPVAALLAQADRAYRSNE